MIRITGLMTALVVAGGVAVPAASVGAQDAAQTVAVAPFNVHEARGDSRDFQGVGSALADLLASELRAGGAHVVDRAAMRRTSALQPTARDGMLGRQAAVAAAKLLGAQRVVYGGFTADAAGKVRIDARAVNVETGAVEFSERLQGHGDEVMALLHQLAGHLATGMSLTVSASTAQGSTLPLRALVNYGKGLDATDRGDRALARTLLQGVVRDHPDFAPALAALAAAGER